MYDLIRDAFYWKLQNEDSFGTINTNIVNDPDVRYSAGGAVAVDKARFRGRTLANLNNLNHRSIGCLIAGPDSIVRPNSDEFVPYHLKGYAHAYDGGMACAFGIGAGPASPNGTSTFTVDEPIMVGRQERSGSGTCCYIDDVIMLNAFGTVDSVDLSARALSFFCQVWNTSGGNISTHFVVAASVERLDVAHPRVRDRRLP